MIDINAIDFDKMDGFAICIVQDICSRKVLMAGVQNEAAVKKSLETKKVTLFSRTKQRLWTKGETSGNFLEIVEAQLDCDNDTILFQVNAPKATCHTGTFTCFDN